MTNTQGGKLIGFADLETDVAEVLAAVELHDGHFHCSNYVYGQAAAAPFWITRPSTNPIRVTGGTDVFGTSVLLDKGGVISGTWYDPSGLQVVAVETANIATIIRFYSAVLGTGVAYAMEADNEIVTASGHGLIDGDRVIFDTMAPDETHGVTRSIVYHVRDMSGTTFKVALTNGGAAVTIDADLTGNIKKVTPTFTTEKLVSMAATNADSAQLTVPTPKILSASALYCEARSHGASKWVDFFIDLHTYA
jgi:predicted enzyme related to lactoylglutathione lyase